MQVYEYIIVRKTKTPACADSGELELLTQTPILAVAQDTEQLKKRAIHNTVLPGDISIDDVEVIVRPFA